MPIFFRTSGLLVVAKDAASHAGLCSQFAAREVTRRYDALHVGTPPDPKGRVEAPLGRDPGNRLRMAVIWAPGARGVRPAASRYALEEVLAHGGASRCSWRLETGRTHQVRVHAKHVGSPLIGDPLYGGTPGAALASLGRAGIAQAAAQGALETVTPERPCLHAGLLGFVHPITGKRLEFSAPPPPDFEAVLQALRALG